MRTRGVWVWMISMVACGGSGSETPPPVEPIAPAWTDSESESDPSEGRAPAVVAPTEPEASDELAPPEEAE